jgi:hypothetical protein
MSGWTNFWSTKYLLQSKTFPYIFIIFFLNRAGSKNTSININYSKPLNKVKRPPASKKSYFNDFVNRNFTESKELPNPNVKRFKATPEPSIAQQPLVFGSS